MHVKNICGTCDGKCCRYFALEIDKPTSKRDFEDIRWYLAHENTRVFVEDGEWHLEVQNVCRHLDGDSRCRIYDDRPAICRDHKMSDCEGDPELEFDREHEFNSDDELAQFAKKFLAKKKMKKKKGKGKKKKGT
ncbi:YkgJ family cysteine cluster protein [bacterium]|nr:YkgJ family cysteine cluster protein [bacterium]